MKEMRGIHKFTWRMPSAVRCAALAVALGITTAAQAATPLAVWNGDFNTATTRNGVTFDVNGNTVNEDGTVTISSSGSGGIKFTVDKTYNYITTVFTVKNLNETAASDRVLVALGGSTGYYTGVYLKSGGLSTGGVNGNNGAWGTVTYDGTVSSVADANTTRTFAATQVNAGTLQNGFHLYEDVGNGTSGGTIVYGGNGNNGLYGTQTYDKVLIGGGLSGSTGSLGSMTDLVVVSVAIYVSDAGWPLDSAGRRDFAMPTPVNISQAGVTISQLNTAVAGTSGNVFVNLADGYYLTADATAASNLVFPYDTSITVADTTLTVTGGMPVKPGSSITSIDGSGTVVYTSTDTLPASSGFFASTWTGTTWLNGGTRNNFVPSNLGNANSVLRFTDITGFPSKAQHSTGVPKYELVNGTAGYGLYVNNGYSCDANGGYSYTRTPKLLGSGTLKCAGSAGSVLFIVDDWSEFTGVLTLTNKAVWFGVEPPTSNGSGIDILASGTIGVGAGKTFAVPSNISSWTYTSFVGSGTVTTTVGLSANTKATDTKWTGTVEVAANATTTGAQVSADVMGNANSKVVLKGLSGSTHYFPSGANITATLQLDGDVTINNGNDKTTATIAKLTGTGNLTFNWSPSNYMYMNIKDVSEYEGTIAAGSKNTITLGVSTAPVVGDLIAKVDSSNHNVSTTVNVNNSDIGVRGELTTVNGVYGLYTTTAATVGGNSYSTVAAAVAAAEEGDTVTLSRTAYAEAVAVSENITIDLNGNPLNADSFSIAEGKTLNIANGSKQINVPSITGGGAIVATNNLRLKLSDATATTSLASIDVTGYLQLEDVCGEIEVAGDVTVSGAFTIAPAQVSSAVVNHSTDYTVKLTAANVTAASITGGGTIETTGAVTTAGGTFYGVIDATGGINASGSFTANGIGSINGTLNITGGTFSVADIMDSLSSSVSYDFDATDTDDFEFDTDDATLITKFVDASGNRATYSSDKVQANRTTMWTPQNKAKLTTDYFGGKPSFYFDESYYPLSDGTKQSQTFFFVYEAVEGGTGKILRNYYYNDYISLGSTYNWSVVNYNTECNSWASYINGEKTTGPVTTGTPAVLSVPRKMATSTRTDAIGGDFKGAFAEVLLLKDAICTEQRKAIETHLMAKWDINSATYDVLGADTEIAFTTGATLDLGGLAQTVKSITGSGTVQNGEITITDDLAIPTGCTLVLPVGSTYTLANAATVNVATDTDAGTITLTHKAATISVTDPDTQEVTTTVYASVEEALADYTEGTLTICEDTTLALAEEVSVGSVVVADGVNLTITQAPPFTTTFENGALTCTRVASTFVYTGAAAYSATSGNFEIGGVATPAVPGEDDTVQFDTATTITIGDSNISYTAFILNADVTVTGAGSNYLRVTSYTGNGTLILGNYGWLSPAATSTINCPLKIDGDDTRIYIAGYNTSVKGKMTGSGTLKLTMWANSDYYGNSFKCNGSEFYGTIQEYQPKSANAKRNNTSFNDTDFSNAKVILSDAGSNCGLAFIFSSSSSVIKFGSLNGKMMSTNANSYRGHATIEVGNLGLDDEISGHWFSNDSSRSPYLRKVGTGTLTTSVTDTYGYILNGGTLVVMAAAAQKEVTTEKAGYEVVSTPNYENETLVSTTYTLRALPNTWTGADENDNNWTTPGNWSLNVAPFADTPVIFPEGTHNAVVTGWGTAKCASMTVNGTLTLTQTLGETGNCYCLDINGNVSGKGKIVLSHAGIWNATSNSITISVPIEVVATSDSMEVSRIGGVLNNGGDAGAIVLTSDLTVEAGARLQYEIDVQLNGGKLEVDGYMINKSGGYAKWLKVNGGTVNLNEGGELSICRFTAVGAMAINFNGGTLTEYGSGGNFDKIIGGQTASWGDQGTITLTVKEKGLTVNTDANTTILPVLAGDGESTGGGLTKTGTGTLTLSAVPTFTGAITVEGGSVVVPVAAEVTLGGDTYVSDSTETTKTLSKHGAYSAAVDEDTADVPYSWVKSNVDGFDGMTEEQIVTALAANSATLQANGYNYFTCYALGLDPEDADDKPLVSVSVGADGNFVVTLTDKDGNALTTASNVMVTPSFYKYNPSTRTYSASPISSTIAPANVVGEDNVGYIRAKIDVSAE